jgi:transcriptional regulator with XRE-family HTH domain
VSDDPRPVLCTSAGTVGDSTAAEGDALSTEDAVALEIRRRRLAAGWSQGQLARKSGFDRQYISRAESPARGLPSERLVSVLDAALGAEGELIALWVRAADARAQRRQEMAGPTDDYGQDGLPNGLVLGVLNPVDALDMVDACTVSIVDRYEVEGPTSLAAEVHALREVCRDVARQAGKGLRRRVALTSARQAALLAYMSVNLDRHDDAQAFALEASMLATAARDSDLLAWIKGTQSFAAYYQGRYGDAVRYARAGLLIAGSGDQRARLLSNGVARAAGKLGDTRTVEESIGTALELSDGDGRADGLTPCIGFGSYSQSRTLANAATAYLSLGRYTEVLEMTGRLEGVVEDAQSEWSRALVRLDAATAHARGPHADLDHAATMGMGALAEARGNPIASIGTRAGALADDLARHGGRSGRAEDFRGALREWHTSTKLIR